MAMNKLFTSCIIRSSRNICRNGCNKSLKPVRFISSSDYKSGGDSQGSRLRAFKLSAYFAGGCLLAYKTYSERKKIDVILSKLLSPLTFATCSPPDGKNGQEKKSIMFNFIADAVESCTPGVVFIEVTSSRGRQSFFRHSMPTSCGSGFFVSHDGLVLTNAHVVDDSEEVTIKMADGKRYQGRILASDPMTDLAVVKVIAGENEVFPSLKLGTSSTVRAGEWVAALGSPLQLSNTITSGIVSSVQRAAGELGLPNSDMQYIQTDAAINVGNSGGPLINLDGEVIGINSITVQAVSGISFAIPIDIAKEFLQTSKNTKEKKSHEPKTKPYQRYFIGITMLTLTPVLAEELRRKGSRYGDISEGVLVARVAPRSPAERDGLMSGDIIVSINGEAVESAGQVHSAVLQGKPMKIQVQRGQSLVSLAIHPQPLSRM